MAGGPVTVLFTDLVSSTELLQRVGDEQAQRVFRAHHRLLGDAVTGHGGHEVKWLGDGLMSTLADGDRGAGRCGQGTVASGVRANQRTRARAGVPDRRVARAASTARGCGHGLLREGRPRDRGRGRTGGFGTRRAHGRGVRAPLGSLPSRPSVALPGPLLAGTAAFPVRHESIQSQRAWVSGVHGGIRSWRKRPRAGDPVSLVPWPSDRALALSEKAVALAKRVEHPISRARSLVCWNCPWPARRA